MRRFDTGKEDADSGGPAALCLSLLEDVRTHMYMKGCLHLRAHIHHHPSAQGQRRGRLDREKSSIGECKCGYHECHVKVGKVWH